MQHHPFIRTTTPRPEAAQFACSFPQAQLSSDAGRCLVQEQTPSAEDAQKRREILQQIDELVQTGLPDYPGLCIRPYGSYVSGLYCPSGDLDLSIEGTPTGG